MTKIEALAKYLEISAEDINETNWGTLEAGGGEFLVLTDEEADDKAYIEIEESLWAFNADFIIDMCGFSGGEKSLIAMQRESCEDCNDFIKAMIKGTCGLDSFIEAAIESDGRGHFIATYDFEEVEQDEYFIYRVE